MMNIYKIRIKETALILLTKKTLIHSLKMMGLTTAFDVFDLGFSNFAQYSDGHI